MKKIPTLFQRGPDRLAIDAVMPGCEWVLDGEGRPTEKIDGTACMVRDGRLFKRYDARDRTPPEGFEPCEPAPDPVTGHWPGWLLVGSGPEDRWHREAWESVALPESRQNGTYELVGPKVQKNPYRLDRHDLWAHGVSLLRSADDRLTFLAIRDYLASVEIEGIVWWHPDGRRAKVKRRDFGLVWPVRS